MNLEAGLYSYLSTKATVIAITSTRIYPVMLPQNPTFPCIHYNVTGANRTSTFNEGQTDYVGLQVDIHCWGETYKSAKELQYVVQAAVQNYRGSMGTVAVDKVFVYDPVDVYEDQIQAYRCVLPVIIYHTE